MTNCNFIPVFIPSYHRPNNVKTLKYLQKIGYATSAVHVFIDDETDDIEEYKSVVASYGANLHVFSMDEARRRFDYVHRPSVGRRSAGQARNMFADFAKENGIDFYCVQDDDTRYFEVRFHEYKTNQISGAFLNKIFSQIEFFMRSHHIGLFGLSQSGDVYGDTPLRLMRWKVMNCSFYLTPYIYHGERGVQDNDTSQFVGILNAGLFTGSIYRGLILKQCNSASQSGGLTDNYRENKLLNKALVTPIQFPSAIHAEKQVKNGGRLHHRIKYKYLAPLLMKVEKGNNIAWDLYPEDVPFTNEPIRCYELNR